MKFFYRTNYLSVKSSSKYRSGLQLQRNLIAAAIAIFFLTILPLNSFGQKVTSVSYTTNTGCTESSGDTFFVSVSNVRKAASGATLKVWYNGDFGASTEWFDVYDEGNNLIGKAGPYPSGGDCAGWNSVSFTVTSSDMQSWTADGKLKFLMDGTSAVSQNVCASGNCAYIEISYTGYAIGNDAAAINILPEIPCSGSNSIQAVIGNGGDNLITSAKINWSVDGVLQTPVTFSGSLDSLFGKGKKTDTVSLGSITFGSASKVIKVWTSDPNSSTDSVNINDTITISKSVGLNGTYTIGGTGADFASFTAVSNALNSYGICGPVLFNISSGTYTDRLVLDNITGASSTNTITFNGGSKSSTTLQYSATSTADQQTVLIKGTDYVTVKNMTIKTNGSTYGNGIGIVLSDYITIDSTDVTLNTTSTSSNFCGICASANETTLTYGNTTNYTTVSNTNVTGGYYGVLLIGTDAVTPVIGNRIINSTVKDFYYIGTYMYYADGFELTGNTVTSSRNGSNYGMYNYYVSNYKIENNHAYSGYMAMAVGRSNFDYNKNKRSSIINNMLQAYSTTTGYSLYAYYGQKLDIYHNTVVSDGGYGIYLDSAYQSDIRNNIFVSKSSSAYALYSTNTSFTSTYPLDYNIYYAPSNSSGIYWRGNAYSITNWFSSFSNMNANSHEEDPGFVSSTDLHLTAGTRPQGADLSITKDIDGDPRCPHAPSMGADESDKGSPADPANPDHICTGTSIVYNFSPPKGMTNSEYGTKWTISSITFKDANNNSSSNTSTVYPSSSGAGKFTFSPTSTDAGKTFLLTIEVSNLLYSACDSTFSRYVEVHTPPVAAFNTSATTVCRGTAVSYTNASTGATEYKWYLGNGLMKKDTSFTYTHGNEGTYTVSLVAINPGCRDSIAKTVTVQGPATGVAFKQGAKYDGYFFNGTANDPDLACVRDTLMYEITPPPAFGNGDYGTKWEVASYTIKSTTGKTATKDSLAKPSSSGPGAIIFMPTFAEADLTYVLTATFKALNSVCKDTTVVRYISVSTSPTANFNYKGQCVGEATFFTDASTVAQGLVVRKYEFGVGNAFATTSNPTYTYQQAGEYTVTYTVTGKGGCSDVIKKKITIYDKPTVEFDVPATVCAGNPATFINKSSGNGTTITRYKWSFTEGTKTDTSALANAAHTYTAPGSYTATLQVWTDGGCNASITKTITVVDAPTASFPQPVGCLNQPITFTNSSTGATSYEWRFSDNQTFYTEEVTRKFEFPSTYEVTMVAISPSGCRDSMTKTINLYPQPVVDYVSTGQCAGQVINFTDASTVSGGGSIVEWLWSFDGGAPKSGNNVTHTFTTAGSHQVKLKVKSNSGCYDSLISNITIDPKPVADITVPGNACIEVATTFQNNSTGTGNTYKWTFGDGGSSTDAQPSYTYTTQGNYQVKLVVTNNRGCKDSVTKTLKVGLGPSVPFDWCADGRKVHFYLTDKTFSTYEWTFGDALGGTATGTDPVYTYLSANGEYDVTVTVTDAIGCVGVYTATVGTGFLENSTVTTCKPDAIQDPAAAKLRMNIYPNPFSHKTMVEYELLNSQQVRVTVWDATGKEVAVLSNGMQQAGKQQVMLDASEHNLQAGLYMIRIETEGAVAASQVLHLK